MILLSLCTWLSSNIWRLSDQESQLCTAEGIKAMGAHGWVSAIATNNTLIIKAIAHCAVNSDSQPPFIVHAYPPLLPLPIALSFPPPLWHAIMQSLTTMPMLSTRLCHHIQSMAAAMLLSHFYLIGHRHTPTLFSGDQACNYAICNAIIHSMV